MRVHRLGFVSDDDLGALYGACAAFCYPSLREGFGLPVLEALAHGAAVVTSDGTATAEIVGDAAVLADPFAPATVAEALRRVVDDPALAADLRARAPERARRYPWSRSAELTHDAYREAGR